MSKQIIDETLKTLKQKFYPTSRELKKSERIIRNAFTIGLIGDIPSISRDPKDNHVLAIADVVTLDFIISGDKDLLALKKYNKVPIVTPEWFLDNI